MKKIIIFGAAGNVGSYLTKYSVNFFDSSEYQIVASNRRKTEVFNKLDIEYVRVDITKESNFDKLPQKDVYAVMMLAAKIPSYMDEYNGKEYLSSNVLGTYNVLEYCRKVKVDRILFTTVFDISLSAKDGVVLQPDMKRNFSYKGDYAMYVISKNTAIEMILHYHQEYGIKKFIFRLPTIYNYSSYHYYYPNGIKTKRPLYQMINKAIKGENIEL